VRRPSFIERARGAPAAALLVAINLIVFALAEQAGDTTSPGTLLRFGATWRGLVWQGEYWRLVTSMFLHIGPIHLLWNTYYGFLVSARVEQAIGAPRFLALYLLSGIAGSALSVIGHDAVSAGASGALFGLIGWELMTLRLRIGSFRTMWREPAIRSNLIWLGAWFVLGAFVGFDNFAHAGGLAFGLAFAAALEAPAPRRRTAFTATLLGLAVLVALSTRPLPVLHARELALRAAHSEADPVKPEPTSSARSP
jgi:rhomboid protease GluP